MKPIILAAAMAAAAACTPSPAPGGGAGEPQNPRAPVVAESGAAPGAGSASASAAGEADTTRIAQLEREARALAHAEGCMAEQCRTAPVGSRPCGGPRTYIVYCAAKTDSAALFAKLAELARAEEAYNRQNQMMSTCEFREPPSTRLEAGRCVAASPEGGVSIQ